MPRIVSIITLYYPNESHIRNVNHIAKQSDIVVLYDNSPSSNRTDYTSIKNAIYYNFGINNGLSKAFNYVLKDCKINWSDDDYVIFFDQDSIIPERHIELLVGEFERLKNDNVHVGCIGPVYYDTSFQKEMLPRFYKNINEQTMLVNSIITTSMLCKYSNLKKINFWNEEIFLDLADWDLCWRFASANMSVCITKVSVIRHSVGMGNKKIGPITLRVGNPIREYYQTRDCLKLIKEKYTPIKYKIRFVLMITVRPILHSLFLNNKKKRMKYIVRGLADYIRNINGAIY